jgi:hypothetical protein
MPPDLDTAPRPCFLHDGPCVHCHTVHPFTRPCPEANDAATLEWEPPLGVRLVFLGCALLGAGRVLAWTVQALAWVWHELAGGL